MSWAITNSLQPRSIKRGVLESQINQNNYVALKNLFWPLKKGYSHLSNKRDVMLTDFGKFHPAQNKNPPCTFIDFITKLSIFLQNLMKIFLLVILGYKS
jgi:hypothetical protein